MEAQSSPNTIWFLRSFVKTAVFVTIGISLAGLAGWIFNIPVLRSILPHTASMKVNTALGFCYASISLWLLQNGENPSRRKLIGQFFAVLAIIVGFLSLNEYLFGWDLGIDRFFVKDLSALPSAFPGRMSPVTAICFVLIGVGLLWIGSKLSQHFSIGVACLALVALIGYLFDYQALYQLPGYGSIAIPTACTFLVLAFAVLAARPKLGIMKLITSNVTAGRTMRLLLPVTILLIVFLGWMVEQGERRGFINSYHESVIMIILLILIYSPLIYFYTNRINQAQEHILYLNRLYATLSQVNQTIIRITSRQELFESICKVAVEFGQFRLAWIFKPIPI